MLEFYGADNLPHRPGGWAKIRCVLHEDANPSASFNETKGQFRCFSCDFFGDALDLIQNREGVDYSDSIRRGEEITGEKGDGLSQSVVQPGRYRPARLSDGREGSKPRDDQPVPVGGRRKPRRLG